jgi:hypothetical protein
MENQAGSGCIFVFHRFREKQQVFSRNNDVFSIGSTDRFTKQMPIATQIILASQAVRAFTTTYARVDDHAIPDVKIGYSLTRR